MTTSRHWPDLVMQQPESQVPSDGVVLLSATGISQTYDGQRFQFRDATLHLPRGAKVGLVGANGVGKSSMLRVLAGVDEPECGVVTLRKGARLAYVEQDPVLPPGESADNFIYASGSQQTAALRRFRAAAAAAENDPKELERATALMDSCDAWTLEDKVEQLSAKLHVKHLLHRDAASLSGGERKRAALAGALLDAPDVLLLDEPTNHLDLDAIRLLEDELLRVDSTVLLVTHDRAFLSAVCSEIFELHASALYRHRGSYGDFLQAKQARLEAEGAAAQDARNKLRKELAWVRRQPKARSTKSKARLDAYEELAAKVTSNTVGSLPLQIEGKASRLGTSIIKFENVGVDLDDKCILKAFSYDFKRKDRIGIVGPNGAGKTTFLRVLQQQLPLSTGHIVTGQTVKVGYYAQEGIQLPEEQRVLDFVREAISEAQPEQSAETNEKRARHVLRSFLFPSSRWSERVGKLSGGERRRLQLLQVLSLSPNLLLLDEPTNDWDVDTMAVLEEFLHKFEGVLLMVSHDRWFVDRLCEQLFVIPGDGSGEVRLWSGSLTAYCEWSEAKAAIAAAKAETKIDASPEAGADTAAIASCSTLRDATKEASGHPKKARALSNFELKSLARLELEVDTLAAQVDQLQCQVDRFDPNSNGYTELNEWVEQLTSLRAMLSEKEEQWLSLAERA